MQLGLGFRESPVPNTFRWNLCRLDFDRGNGEISKLIINVNQLSSHLWGESGRALESYTTGMLRIQQRQALGRSNVPKVLQVLGQMHRQEVGPVNLLSLLFGCRMWLMRRKLEEGGSHLKVMALNPYNHPNMGPSASQNSKKEIRIEDHWSFFPLKCLSMFTLYFPWFRSGHFTGGSERFPLQRWHPHL